jgi:hypothetical protein
MRFHGFSLHGIQVSYTHLKRSIALVAVAATFSASLLSGSANGQFGGAFQRVVGGVSISPEGVLRTTTVEDQTKDLAELRAALQGPQGELKNATDRRLVSLKNLQKIVVDCIAQNKAVPEEVMFLGGMTRVENVFVYPERQDIVLSGPAEPWKLNASGSVVGSKSGRPVVCLDDLLCAFQTVQNARKTGISVSIEPTEEGVRGLEQVLKQVKLNGNANPRAFEPAMTRAFGPQQIKLEGVPADSRMARIILAADYRMKLYGMNLAKAPVQGLPSYLEMISKQGGGSQLQSRWWMACDYSAIEHSEDRLAWKISGRGIKTMSEQEQVQADGSFKQTGKVDKLAQRWAEIFTNKLDELAVADPVFGDLRNVMDLCVIAALIESQELQGLANCNLSSIIGDSTNAKLMKCDVAKTLDPQCSFVKTMQGWVVSASGGVMVDSWQVASKVKRNDSLASEKKSASSWTNENSVWQ